MSDIITDFVVYDKCLIYTHCWVDVYEDSQTGKCSYGWRRTPETKGPEFDYDTDATIEMIVFDRHITYTNCTVEVLVHTETGEYSVGWNRTNETEEIIHE